MTNRHSVRGCAFLALLVLAMATANGVPQAVYPEGGLTKDGALRPPKLGLLDYMLRGFDPKGPRDLVFVPVGVSSNAVPQSIVLRLQSKTPPKPVVP